jgi:hypothetical protein
MQIRVAYIWAQNRIHELWNRKQEYEPLEIKQANATELSLLLKSDGHPPSEDILYFLRKANAHCRVDNFNPEIDDLARLSELCSHIVIDHLYFLFPSCSIPKFYTLMIKTNKEELYSVQLTNPSLENEQYIFLCDTVEYLAAAVEFRQKCWHNH